ncbi:hypothetical protein H8S51_011035 [Roseburia rectibacter]|uniref:hypothetical protein n=1 Tax=Roseburia rectibacter TaxID=2763062 RepID=UPI00164B96A2|nr:hypothetical protein [Roseburia rectibacter]UMY98851.1 hypothetical protein H8S51_011035 [Roseburia rectibacter]
MLYNENETRELCKRYDIEIINSDDKDYYKDIEFSMNDIMNEPYIHTVVEKCIVSESMKIPIAMENDFFVDNKNDYYCRVAKEDYYDCLMSVVDSDTVINKAA